MNEIGIGQLGRMSLDGVRKVNTKWQRGVERCAHRRVLHSVDRYEANPCQCCVRIETTHDGQSAVSNNEAATGHLQRYSPMIRTPACADTTSVSGPTLHFVT